MTKIVVTSKTYGEKEILIDDKDFELVNQYKWWIAKRCNTFYAGRSIHKNIEGKREVVYMHRLILGITDKTEIDHKDHNGLNNQRCNLRVSTKKQNGCNKHPRGLSKYLGVGLSRNPKKWRAFIKADGKQKHLGVFESEIAAALAYNEAAERIHGEFANLNIIVS